MGAMKKSGGGSSVKGQKEQRQQQQVQQQQQQQQQAQQQQQQQDSKADKTDEKSRRSCLHKQLRKTKFCMYHLQGVCQFGDNCAFAHSCGELQGAPDLRKTRLCRAFAAGCCKDYDCSFAHTEEELRSTDMFYKKTLCMWYDKGRCRHGDQCRFAHGAHELRARVMQDAHFLSAFSGGLPGASQDAATHPKGGTNAAGGAGAATRLGGAQGGRRAAATAPTGYAAINGIAAGRDAAGLGGGSDTRLEPMFVQPLPGSQVTQPYAAPDIELRQYERQLESLDALALEQLQRSAMASLGGSHPSLHPDPAASAAAGISEAELEQFMRHERQMQQLQRASAAASAAAAAASAATASAAAGHSVPLAVSTDPGSVALGGGAMEADLEKLTQNIAALSLQLSRFEMQMQKRGQQMPGGLEQGLNQALLKQAAALQEKQALLACLNGGSAASSGAAGAGAAGLASGAGLAGSGLNRLAGGFASGSGGGGGLGAAGLGLRDSDQGMGSGGQYYTSRNLVPVPQAGLWEDLKVGQNGVLNYTSDFLLRA